MIEPDLHRFRSSDYLFFLRQLVHHHGWRGLIRQFRYQHRRPFSRALIRKHSPAGFGLEIGVGSYTVAPVDRTVLTDGFSEHASSKSIADYYCRADRIPCADGRFNFVISEHVLEHLANPLKALREWRRVLKEGGVLFLFLPHKERTFDRNRPRTPIQHLIEDENQNVSDDDSTHLEEWLAQVILPGLAPHYSRIPSADHVTNGLVHHHVWVPRDIEEALVFTGFSLVESFDVCPDRTDSFVVVARKGG